MRNFVINFKARFNTGQLNAGIQKVTQNVNAAVGQMQTMGAAGGAAMGGMTTGVQGAIGATQAMHMQVGRLQAPIDSLAHSVRKGDMSFRQLHQAMVHNKTITQQQVALQRGQITGLQLLEGGTMKAQFATNALSTSQVTLAQRIGIAAAAVGAASNKLVNWGKNLQWAGRQITVGLTVPLGFFAVAATKAAEEYDRAMTRVIKVTNFAAAQGTAAFVAEEEALRRQIRNLSDLGTQMGFTSVQTAEAAAEFSQMGYRAKELDQLIDSAQRLAFTSGGEMQDSIELTRIAVQAFGRDLGELNETFARLNMVENNTALSLDELTKGLPVVAAVASSVGIEIEETAGLMAMMKEAGIGASEGATALRTGLIRVVQEATDPAIEAFGRIGLSLEDLQKRHRGNTLGFFDELGTHLQGLTDQGAMDDFTAAIGKLTGTRQASRFISFLKEIPNRTREGTVGFRAWTGATVSSAEAMATFNFEMQQVADSAAGTADRLRAELATAMEQAGHPFLQFANILRQIAVNTVNWFNNLSPFMQGVLKWGLGLVAITGPIMMLVGILSNFIGSAVKLVMGITKWAAGTQLLSTEQHILNAAIRQGILTQESYNASILRGVGLQQQLTMATQNRFLNPAVAPPPGTQMQPIVSGGHIPGPGTSAAPRRAGALGVLAGAGGIALVGSAVKDVAEDTSNWEGALMKVLMGVTLLAPAFKALKGPIAAAAKGATGILGVVRAIFPVLLKFAGPIGWAVTALMTGFGIWKWWKSEAEGVNEESAQIKSEAQGVAKQLGLSWNNMDKLGESTKTTAQILQDMRRENKPLVDDLNKLAATDMKAYEQRIYQMGMEMIWQGTDPELVQEQLRTWLREMGVTKIPIEFDEEGWFASYDRLYNKMEEMGANLRAEMEKGWWRPSSEGAIVTQFAEEAARHFALATDEGFAASGASFQAGIQQILLSTDDVAKQIEMIQSLEYQYKNLTGLEFESAIPADFADRAHLYSDKVLAEIRDKAMMTSQTLASVPEDGIASASAVGNLLRGIIGMTGANIEDQIEAAKQRLAELREFNPTGWFKDATYLAAHKNLQALEAEAWAAANAADGLAAGADGAEDDVDALAAAAERSSTAFSALRSAVGSVIGNIASVATSELQDRFDAEDDMWASRLERLKDSQDEEREVLKETHDTEKELLKDSWDSRIKALNDVEEEEDELERRRQHNFRLQKLRDDYLNRRAQGHLGAAAALARGEIDEAARINQELRAATTDYHREVREEEASFEEGTRDRQRDAAIDAYETARDEALETLEVEQKAAEKALEASQESRAGQVEASRDAAKKQNEIIEKQFNHQLEQWKKVTPRTEQEYQDHLGELGRIMERFGMKDLTEISNEYKGIFGHSITAGFSEGTRLATLALAEDKRWHEAGKVISEQIIAGLLGEDYTPPKASSMPHIVSGGQRAPLGERAVAHTGGLINRSTAGQGIKPGEHNTILQTGEYVIDRDTVDKFGPGFFKGLQRYHEGGLVDHIGDVTPLTAMSHMLGTVLAGKPLASSGTIGAAAHKMITGNDFQYDPSSNQYGKWGDTASGTAVNVGNLNAYGNLQSPDRDATWRKWADLGGKRDWRYGLKGHIVRTVSSVLAAIPGGQPITSAYRPGSRVAGSGRVSRHASGHAVDIGVLARRDGGSLQSERLGDTIAATFDNTPGVRQVLWKTMTGGNHYNHVHVGWHKGGLLGTDSPTFTVPALASGADVNFDNTLANLHKGERVLTAPLTNKLDEGLSRLANGGGVVYDVDVVVQGNASKDDANSIANAVIRKIQQKENRQGRNRRVG